MNTGILYFWGGHIVTSGDSVTMPTGHVPGTRLTVMESHRSYILDDNNWQETTTSGFRNIYNIGTSSIPAQTLIGISGGFVNNTGNQNLQVFVNGILQVRDTTPSSRDYDFHYSGAGLTGVRFNYVLAPSGVLSFISLD